MGHIHRTLDVNVSALNGTLEDSVWMCACGHL